MVTLSPVNPPVVSPTLFSTSLPAPQTPIVCVLATPEFRLWFHVHDPESDDAPIDLTAMLAQYVALGREHPDDRPGGFEATMLDAVGESVELGHLAYEGTFPRVFVAPVPANAHPVEDLTPETALAYVHAAIVVVLRNHFASTDTPTDLDLLGE